MEWNAAGPEATLVATVMFLVALGVTAGSFWYTHVLTRPPTENFLYGQVLLDVALVTGIVHITGGPESSFAPMYILVISSGALLLPLPGGVLIGVLASMVYFADLVWGFQSLFTLDVALQIGLFTLVALITGFLGDRLRRAGIALGAVESELRQLRLDTSDILANLSTGVLTVDGQGRLVYANPAAESLLGLDASQWLATPVLGRVEEVAPGMGRILRRAVEDRESVGRFRTRLLRPGERQADATLGVSTAILERGDGMPPSATAIFQDITDLERVEALNRRTSRLEAVAELSASLAHEIKNPLASIRSSVEQLAGTRLDGDERATLERLVLQESDRLSHLLSEFLDYSGLELGPRTPVALDLLVQDCVTFVRQHPEAEEVEIVCRGHEASLAVPGDRDLLHRALFNLLLNAVQFSGPGGRVEVTLEDRSGRTRPRGSAVDRPVTITVRDSGPGVDGEVAPRIFDPFFTTREGGSGLGLAVVHRAVEAHDGAVFVDAAEGGGAEFAIHLPKVPSTDGEGNET